MNLEDKINIVEEILEGKKVAIGFSGGADSTLIAYISSKVAEDTLAITINNHLFPKDFIEHTQNVTESFGIKHEIVDINFYDDERFMANDSRRCHTCRRLMYDEIEGLAREKGFDFICDGNNISDLVIDRPGILITYEKGFQTPLIEARLTSKEIHEYLNNKNIPYSRSTTCLATRIPTNTPATAEKINRIRCCEDYIMGNTGCEIVKVRDFEDYCIVETEDIGEILKNDKFKQINDELKHQGFGKVALNLSQIDDNECIELDYHEGGFAYQLPYEINLDETKIINEDNDKIELENITINKDGLITGNGFETYDDAVNAFMNILPKIRRKLGE